MNVNNFNNYNHIITSIISTPFAEFDVINEGEKFHRDENVF